MHNLTANDQSPVVYFEESLPDNSLSDLLQEIDHQTVSSYLCENSRCQRPSQTADFGRQGDRQNVWPDAWHPCTCLNQSRDLLRVHGLWRSLALSTT